MAAFTGPSEAPTGQIVTFDGNSSSGQVPIVYWEWSFGDGTTATGPIVSHVYANPGSYRVKLTVTDQRSNQDSEEKTFNSLTPVQPTPGPTQVPPTNTPSCQPLPTPSPTDTPAVTPPAPIEVTPTASLPPQPTEAAPTQNSGAYPGAANSGSAHGNPRGHSAAANRTTCSHSPCRQIFRGPAPDTLVSLSPLTPLPPPARTARSPATPGTLAMAPPPVHPPRRRQPPSTTKREITRSRSS